MRLLTIFVALVLVGCGPPIYGKHLDKHKSSTKNFIIKTYGKPNFVFVHSDTSYMAYLLGRDKKKCSALFAIKDGQVKDIDKIGPHCAGVKTNTQAKGLLNTQGKHVLDLIRSFGSPHTFEKSANGIFTTMTYLVREGSDVSELIKTLGYIVPFLPHFMPSTGIKEGRCTVQIVLKNNVVVRVSPPKEKTCLKSWMSDKM